MEHKSRGKVPGALAFPRWIFILDAVLAMLFAQFLIWLTEYLYDKYKDQVKMSLVMLGMKIEGEGKELEKRFTVEKPATQNFEHVEEDRIQQMIKWVHGFSDRIQGKAA